MRTNLFLSTLFAVTLVGGAAFADKTPKAVERLRAHGDMVDKSYKGTDRSAAPQASPEASQARQVTQVKNPVDRASSHINCSDSGAECASARGGSAPGAAQASGLEASAASTNRAARWPAFLDKIMGSDRTNFNEAGEDQGMSIRAARRAWSSAAHNNSGASSTATIPLAQQQQVVRTQQQASSDRMSCNEADECMMSSKAAKKDWAYESVKKGTWQGPEAKQPSNAERAIAAMRGGKGTAAGKGAEAAAKIEAAKQDHDHQH